MKIGSYEISRKVLAISLASIGVLVLAGVALIASSAAGENETVLTFPVARGPLTISVSERGTIKARQQEVIKCLVEGQTTIIYLVDEGTRVKQGELLVELDSSKLEDTKVNQQIQVQNAEANFIRARENLEVVKNQAIADVSKAELDAQFAKEDLRNYDEGDYPNEYRTAENKITIANEELQRATEKLRWTEVLFQEKYVSQTELQADRLSQKKAQLDLELAKDALRLLQDYSYKRKNDELKSSVEQTALALERAKRKAAADLAQAEADLKAKESEYQRQTSQLAKTLRMIESCKMYAPTDGLVVYATTGQGGWRNQEPLDEGATVRERQDLIYLPTASEMMAEVKIHESNLNKIRSGLPVAVTIDALPGQRFMGRVSRIAPLPDGTSMWMNPDLKVYNTEITLDGDGSALKTGMSCMAEIIVETHREALHVPIQAVVRENGTPTVYVLNGRDAEPRHVKLGMDNNNRVHVLEGLSEGEYVLATPPIRGTTDAGESAMASAEPAVVSPATAPVATAMPNGRAPGTQPAVSAAPSTQPGAGAQGAVDWSNPEQREQMRQRMASMSPEERQAEMRRRMESMTPEQRAAFESRRNGRRGDGEGRGEGAGFAPRGGQ